MKDGVFGEISTMGYLKIPLEGVAKLGVNLRNVLLRAFLGRDGPLAGNIHGGGLPRLVGGLELGAFEGLRLLLVSPWRRRQQLLLHLLLHANRERVCASVQQRI